MTNQERDEREEMDALRFHYIRERWNAIASTGPDYSGVGPDDDAAEPDDDVPVTWDAIFDGLCGEVRP